MNGSIKALSAGGFHFFPSLRHFWKSIVKKCFVVWTYAQTNPCSGAIVTVTRKYQCPLMTAGRVEHFELELQTVPARVLLCRAEFLHSENLRRHESGPFSVVITSALIAFLRGGSLWLKQTIMHHVQPIQSKYCRQRYLAVFSTPLCHIFYVMVIWALDIVAHPLFITRKEWTALLFELNSKCKISHKRRVQSFQKLYGLRVSVITYIVEYSLKTTLSNKEVCPLEYQLLSLSQKTGRTP